VLVGSAAAWWYETDSTVSGTVDDTDWEGRVNLGWKAPQKEKPSYGGTAFTEADEVIDEMYVSTKGSKWCGSKTRLSISWYQSGLVNDTWIVGRSGKGTFSNWECLWHPAWNVTLKNEAEHRVWDDNDSDSDEHEVELTADLNP